MQFGPQHKLHNPCRQLIRMTTVLPYRTFCWEYWYPW